MATRRAYPPDRFAERLLTVAVVAPLVVARVAVLAWGRLTDARRRFGGAR